jgi:molybdenum cofactor cytidylyltransferase
MNIAIIILAAGASTRMGAPKQLLLVDGKTLIKRTCDTAMDTTCHPIVLVLGANRNLFRKETERMPITVIDNPQWEKGMSSSIKMGLAGAYMTEKAIEAVIFLTVDMPYVSAELINKMIEKAESDEKIEIVACKYENQMGIPVLFKRSMFTDLLELSGDEGAKKVVVKNKDKVAFIDFPGGKLDLDTVEEYRNFVSKYNSN